MNEPDPIVSRDLGPHFCETKPPRAGLRARIGVVPHLFAVCDVARIDLGVAGLSAPRFVLRSAFNTCRLGNLNLTVDCKYR